MEKFYIFNVTLLKKKLGEYFFSLVHFKHLYFLYIQIKKYGDNLRAII